MAGCARFSWACSPSSPRGSWRCPGQHGVVEASVPSLLRCSAGFGSRAGVRRGPGGASARARLRRGRWWGKGCARAEKEGDGVGSAQGGAGKEGS
ncbi:hypothetical protein E2562_002007 [Oryza meyeriana var. granulata]|uniref:Uncharacterized protein n=1 Tax=Oryza meyeriana var. granulata TaxID=110450 RepID=A0A6G1C3A9_9ORYZ|nr:hypothetical protein E2562_002007 [Oryza meyeriana var. granulata]